MATAYPVKRTSPSALIAETIFPYGLYGGKQGRGSINILHHNDGEEEVLQTMISTSMEADERIYHRQAGGGGWGDPLLRAPADVARDVKNGKVSLRSSTGIV